MNLNSTGWSFLFGPEPALESINHGGPICVSVWVKPGPPAGNRLDTRNLVSWRIFGPHADLNAIASAFGGMIGSGQYMGLSNPPFRRPPRPVKEIPWLVKSELKAALRSALGNIPRTFRRSIQEMLLEEVQRLQSEWEQAHPATGPGSPLRIIGPGRPWDWTEDEHAAGPQLARYSARVLTGAPAMFQAWPQLPDADKLKTALAYLIAVRLAIETGAVRHAQLASNALDVFDVRPRYSERGSARATLRRFQEDPYGAFHHLGLDAPHWLTLDTYHDQTYLPHLAIAQGMLDTLPRGPMGHILSELVHSATEELLTALNDGESPVRYTWTPEPRLLLAMLHWNIYPDPSTPRENLARLVQLASDRLAHDDDHLPRPDDLRALMREAGVRENPRPHPIPPS